MISLAPSPFAHSTRLEQVFFFSCIFPRLTSESCRMGPTLPFTQVCRVFFYVTILFVDLIKCENDYVFLVWFFDFVELLEFFILDLHQRCQFDCRFIWRLRKLDDSNFLLFQCLLFSFRTLSVRKRGRRRASASRSIDWRAATPFKSCPNKKTRERRIPCQLLYTKCKFSFSFSFFFCHLAVYNASKFT